MPKFLEPHIEANNLMCELINDGWLESGADMLYNDPNNYLRNWFVSNHKDKIQQIQNKYSDAILHYEYSGLDNEGGGALYATWYKVI